MKNSQPMKNHGPQSVTAQGEWEVALAQRLIDEVSVRIREMHPPTLQLNLDQQQAHYNFQLEIGAARGGEDIHQLRQTLSAWESWSTNLFQQHAAEVDADHCRACGGHQKFATLPVCSCPDPYVSVSRPDGDVYAESYLAPKLVVQRRDNR